MKLVADLHIHSHYSRATSKQLDLEHLCLVAQQKGVGLIGTGDFTHPKWLEEIEQKLVPIPGEEGLYELREDLRKVVEKQIPPSCRSRVRFLLSVEISSIYKQDDAVRKVHNLVFVPNFSVAKKLNQRLAKIGNLHSDGRPILGLSSKHLLEYTLESDPLSYLIPAHVWTPHFAVFGSMSGFNSIEACFGDLSQHIFALETGLSSDPAMNHRISMLDKYTLISNSDAHSAAKLAREANIVDIDPSFGALRHAMETADPKQFLGTIEFYPEEGKYHLDGHRNCSARLWPKERMKRKGLCPVCGKPVTVGVLSRIEELADRPEHPADLPSRARPFINLVPLSEIIAETLGVGEASQAVQRLHHKLLAHLGNELSVLREIPLKDIETQGGALLAEGIRRVREGQLHIEAGYDGEYGTVKIFSPQERHAKTPQIALFA